MQYCKLNLAMAKVIQCFIAHISRAKWVKVFGTTYKKLCAVVIGTSCIHPQFGSIEDVLVNKDIMFTVKKYTTLYYSEHSNAFVIQKTSELCTVYHRELYHYIPLHTGPNYWNRISCCFKNSRFYSINNDHSCRTILYIHWD